MNAINGLQILLLLVLIAQGIVFVGTGTQPAQFVTLVYTAVGVGVAYAILEGVDRVVV